MFKKVCNILSGIILALLAILAVVMIAPALLGFKSMAVLSGSMTPKIPVGSVVYAKAVDVSELEVGDIVTYRLSGDTMVTHRIIGIDEEAQQLHTQGDANETEDAAPVAFTNVVGKVFFHLPLLGYLTIYAKTPIGIAAICGVLIVLILLIFLPDIRSGEDKKETDRKQHT